MNLLFLARCLTIYFLVVVANSIAQGNHSIGGFFDLKRSHDLIEQTVEGIKLENEQIDTELTRISSSSDYANKVLRDKYHLIEEDEELIFFDD